MLTLGRLVADHVQILQFDWTLFFNDKPCRTTNRANPIGHLIGVAHCG
jgi:hypothetical protein